MATTPQMLAHEKLDPLESRFVKVDQLSWKPDTHARHRNESFDGRA